MGCVSVKVQVLKRFRRGPYPRPISLLSFIFCKRVSYVRFLNRSRWSQAGNGRSPVLAFSCSTTTQCWMISAVGVASGSVEEAGSPPPAVFSRRSRQSRQSARQTFLIPLFRSLRSACRWQSWLHVRLLAKVSGLVQLMEEGTFWVAASPQSLKDQSPCTRVLQAHLASTPSRVATD